MSRRAKKLKAINETKLAFGSFRGNDMSIRAFGDLESSLRLLNPGIFTEMILSNGNTYFCIPSVGVVYKLNSPKDFKFNRTFKKDCQQIKKSNKKKHCIITIKKDGMELKASYDSLEDLVQNMVPFDKDVKNIQYSTKNRKQHPFERYFVVGAQNSDGDYGNIVIYNSVASLFDNLGKQFVLDFLPDRMIYNDEMFLANRDRMLCYKVDDQELSSIGESKMVVKDQKEDTCYFQLAATNKDSCWSGNSKEFIKLFHKKKDKLYLGDLEDDYY